MLNKKIDELVDRYKGRRRIETEGAVELVGDFYFDEVGTKWLCVNVEQEEKGRVFDFDDVEPFTIQANAQRIAGWFVVVLFTAASIVGPLYWIFWRNE